MIELVEEFLDQAFCGRVTETSGDAIKICCEDMLELETEFCSLIKFTSWRCDADIMLNYRLV
jgi:hypothetical protein